MADERTIPIQLIDGAPANTAPGAVNAASAQSAVRPNPMVWEDEEAASGVFIGSDNPLEALDLLGVPGMILPEVLSLPDDFAPSERLRHWLDRLVSGLEDAAGHARPIILPLAGLDEVECQAIDEILGEGEVSGEVTLDGTDYRVVEATLAGVWRISGDGGEAWVEIARVPGIVRQAAQSLERAPFEVSADLPGVMNAPAVLAEISERAAQCADEGAARHGFESPNHVLNFTLLPMSEADHEMLTGVLGRAKLELRSGGFGDCQVMATRYRHVWAVQYVNAMGHVILDTVEIGGVPSAVAAASEDMEDSAGRLAEILEAYL